MKLKSFDHPINIISVYSPAWSIDQAAINNQIEGVDISDVKLKENPMLWPTEIIWLTLQEKNFNNSFWIVGGDYNSSPRFDDQKADGASFLLSTVAQRKSCKE